MKKVRFSNEIVIYEVGSTEDYIELLEMEIKNVKIERDLKENMLILYLF